MRIGDGPKNVDPNTIVGFLIETFRSYVNPDIGVMTAETEIDTLGIDSFDFVEILFKIEDQYKIDIDYNANFQFSDLKTIGGLADEVFQFIDRDIAA